MTKSGYETRIKKQIVEKEELEKLIIGGKGFPIE